MSGFAVYPCSGHRIHQRRYLAPCDAIARHEQLYNWSLKQVV